MKHIEASIITLTQTYVKQCQGEGEPRQKQLRQVHTPIPTQKLDPAMRSFARHIVRCGGRGERVRVPAMRASDWGQLLRGMEIRRALA